MPQQVADIPDPNALVDLSSPDTKPASSSTSPVLSDETMVDKIATKNTPARTDASLIANKLEDTPQKTEDANDEPKFKIERMEDLSLLTPVKIHIKTPTKKRKCGDLLKRLHLDDILFEDDDKEQKKKKGSLKVDDDEHCDYTLLSDDAKRQRVSTQSTGTIEAYYRKYHASPVAEEKIITINKAFKKQLAAFIAASFEKWDWFNEEDHLKTIAYWAKQMKPKDCSESKKEWIRELIKGMKDERAQYTKDLTNEFMFTRPTMVKGLRFVKANNSFYARLVYQEPDESDPKKMVAGEEELKVEEEWVRSEFGGVDIQHIINMHQTYMWTDVPHDVEVRIAKHKIVRVRYIPPQVRHVLDYDAMAKKFNEKDVTVASRRKKLGFSDIPQERFEELLLLDRAIPRRKGSKSHSFPLPSKVSRRQLVDEFNKNYAGRLFREKEETKWQKSIIRKAVTYNEKWKGRMENQQETTLDEDFVIMAFGEAFVKELKMSGDRRGFVNVPVGDYKPSLLYEHPNLRRLGAPKVHFNQTDGKDLCVSKSLASALFSIGFHEEATAIDAFGEEIMKGAVVDALEKVKVQARAVLPSWIVIRRLPRRFDWKHDLNARQLVLGVLSASDGSCCHAVCIHGGYVYDANEIVALPLCTEALNYCTSTALVKSTFVEFRRGYMFQYEGQRKERLAKMT